MTVRAAERDLCAHRQELCGLRDRKAITGARADPRLRPVMKHTVDRFLIVPDPRLAVLRDTPRLFLAIRIHLTGPA